jgi:hypothetical protein
LIAIAHRGGDGDIAKGACGKEFSIRFRVSGHQRCSVFVIWILGHDADNDDDR